jgi:hypothetical protein
VISPRDAALTVKPGDLIAAVGTGPVSDLIKLVSIHTHCAVICSGRPAVLAESTSRSTLPDKDDGTIRVGVQVHLLPDWLENYPGQVFLYPLANAMLPEEFAAFQSFLENEWTLHIGYDFVGVAKLGAKRLADNLTAREVGSVFCSQLVTMAYQAASLISPSFRPADMTPDDVCAFPIFAAPLQLK